MDIIEYAYAIVSHVDVQFGTSLKVYADVHKRNVPLLVEQCIQAVERMGGLQKEGIYRISGRQTAVNTLKLEFEKDEQKVDIDQYDIFTIASVLKVYLRELEEPLLAMSPKQQAEYTGKIKAAADTSQERLTLVVDQARMMTHTDCKFSKYN